jgi:hypothetical protein
MSAEHCAVPHDLAALVAYWQGELDPEREAAVEVHIMGCGACAGRLSEVARLGGAVRESYARGHVSAVLSPALVAELADAGVRLREYRVPANGSVHCTVAPDDDLAVARLEASLTGVQRLDVVRIGPGGAVLERMEDVPFDAGRGEVTYAPAIQKLRALGDATVRVQLVDAGAATERVIAGYEFIHSRWQA